MHALIKSYWGGAAAAAWGGANLEVKLTMVNSACRKNPGRVGFAAVDSNKMRSSWNIFLVYGLRLDVYRCIKKW